MIRLVSRNGTDAYSMPVTMAEMAEHLKREDTVEDDEYIDACLRAATEWAEMFTGMVMVDSTFDFTTDVFPTGTTIGWGATLSIYLRRAPLLEVESVTYRNASGGSTVLDSGGYLVDLAGSSIYLSATGSWPDTDMAANAVTVRFRAGFIDYATYPPTVGDIPQTIKAAIKIYAATLYGQREIDDPAALSIRIPWGAEVLLRYHRIDDSLA